MNYKKNIKYLESKIFMLDSILDDYKSNNQSYLRIMHSMQNKMESMENYINELKQVNIEKMPEGVSKEFAKKFGVK